jgi:hypothetical protein
MPTFWRYVLAPFKEQRISCYLRLFHNIEDGGGMILETVGKLVGYTVSHPRNRNHDISLLWTSDKEDEITSVI